VWYLQGAEQKARFPLEELAAKRRSTCRGTGARRRGGCREQGPRSVVFALEKKSQEVWYLQGEQGPGGVVAAGGTADRSPGTYRGKRATGNLPAGRTGARTLGTCRRNRAQESSGGTGGRRLGI
jgi:hypothetical protein